MAQPRSEHNAEQQAGNDELHRHPHAVRPMGARAPVGREDLPATRAGEREDMLEVRRGRRDRPDRRRMEGTAHGRQRQHSQHAAADFEPARGDVLVRNPVGREMEHRPKDDRPDTRADDCATCCPRGNVHGNDHGRYQT
jgi:hypothetical protein